MQEKEYSTLGNPFKNAMVIAGIYFILGVVWILLSDMVVEVLVHDKKMMTGIGILKGWIYVCVTAAVIWWLIYAAFQKIRAGEQKILQHYKELSSAYGELEKANQKLSTSELQLQKQCTELAESQEKHKYFAYHDMLTGLKNRFALYEDLHHILTNHCTAQGALLFVDVENFKYMNDNWGHSFGDELLKGISQRLLSVLEDQQVLYRLAGDEFVIDYRFCESLSRIEAFIKRMMDAFQMPIQIQDHVIHIHFSSGVSLYPQHGNTPDDLLKFADIAMYKAKKWGKGRFVLFHPEMNAEISERVYIETYLRTALEKNELFIHYQPQLDLKTGRIAGFEALLRWQNPQLGLVSPMKFIQVAEDTYQIISIGDWVLRNACSFIKHLHLVGYTELYISVNVSMIQLMEKDFATKVMETLEFLGLEPEHLELEITESILMESYENIENTLALLSQNGVRIALDDFGKGYSSLHYLKQLPVTTLKIDKIFMDCIAEGDKQDKLIGQIISIGREMGMAVVAEGVETQEQMTYLVQHNCDRIQGFLFSRPIPENEVLCMLGR